MGTALPLQPRVKPQPLLLTLLPRTLSLVIPKANGVKKLFATWLKRLATQPAAIYTRGDLTHKDSVDSPAKMKRVVPQWMSWRMLVPTPVERTATCEPSWELSPQSQLKPLPKSTPILVEAEAWFVWKVVNRKPPPLQKLVRTSPGLNERISFQNQEEKNASRTRSGFCFVFCTYPRKGVDNSNKNLLFLENTPYVARNA